MLNSILEISHTFEMKKEIGSIFLEQQSSESSFRMDTKISKNNKNLTIKNIEFNNEFLSLISPQSSTGRMFYVFVRNLLRSYRLNDSYCEAYVLNEAYVRGIQYIEKGGDIYNLSAWLKATSHNIIRELSRQLRKLDSLDDSMLESLPSEMTEGFREDDLSTLKLAFQMLDSKEQKLINLRVVEGRSWKDIRDILRVDGEGDHTEQTLRKRKERIMVKLRNQFHAINSQSELQE